MLENKHKTNIHAISGIRTSYLTYQVAAHLRLLPHRDRRLYYLINP